MGMGCPPPPETPMPLLEAEFVDVNDTFPPPSDSRRPPLLPSPPPPTQSADNPFL